MRRVKSLFTNVFLVVEERLHGQSSIGVGGHMNDVVGADSINEVLRVNAQRN